MNVCKHHTEKIQIFLKKCVILCFRMKFQDWPESHCNVSSWISMRPSLNFGMQNWLMFSYFLHNLLFSNRELKRKNHDSTYIFPAPTGIGTPNSSHFDIIRAKHHQTIGYQYLAFAGGRGGCWRFVPDQTYSRLSGPQKIYSYLYLAVWRSTKLPVNRSWAADCWRPLTMWLFVNREENLI